jgi:hypothetical protein
MDLDSLGDVSFQLPHPNAGEVGTYDEGAEMEACEAKMMQRWVLFGTSAARGVRTRGST